jgi:hypothetical protein
MGCKQNKPCRQRDAWDSQTSTEAQMIEALYSALRPYRYLL